MKAKIINFIIEYDESLVHIETLVEAVKAMMLERGINRVSAGSTLEVKL